MQIFKKKNYFKRIIIIILLHFQDCLEKLRSFIPDFGEVDRNKMNKVVYFFGISKEKNVGIQLLIDECLVFYEHIVICKLTGSLLKFITKHKKKYLKPIL